MGIFARGIVTMMIVGLFIMLLFEDMPAEVSDLMLYAAFFCGSASQAIKQYKGEDK